VGGVFLAIVFWVPSGLWTDVLQTTVASLYALSYLALLVTRLKRVYARKARWLESALGVFATLATLLVFGLAHMNAGIVDSTAGGMISYRLTHGLYLSVATFTTVGFGDLTPTGVGRATASVQALLGYLTLGLVATTIGSIMQERAEKQEGEEEDPGD
jgi:hypothetical protein